MTRNPVHLADAITSEMEELKWRGRRLGALFLKLFWHFSSKKKTISTNIMSTKTLWVDGGTRLTAKLKIWAIGSLGPVSGILQNELQIIPSRIKSKM